MPAIADKRRTFRKLHEAGCFVIPNPWNVGTARYLQQLDTADRHEPTEALAARTTRLSSRSNPSTA